MCGHLNTGEYCVRRATRKVRSNISEHVFDNSMVALCLDDRGWFPEFFFVARISPMPEYPMLNFLYRLRNPHPS